MAKTNKIRLKFAGSVVLVLTTIGVLLAAGGQLNFLGNVRPASIAPQIEKKKDATKPKYSFYDELKKRKIEIDSEKKALSLESLKKDHPKQYVVQIGAFSGKKTVILAKKKAEKFGYAVKVIRSGHRFFLQTQPYASKKAAVVIEKQLKKHGFRTQVQLLKK